MNTLFNTLSARVVVDASGSHTDLYSPSGKLHTRFPAGQPQPRFAKQRSIMLDGILYSLTWQLTPPDTKHLTPIY